MGKCLLMWHEAITSLKNNELWSSGPSICEHSLISRKKQPIYMAILLENGLSRRGQGVQFVLSQIESYPSNENQLESQVQQVSQSPGDISTKNVLWHTFFPEPPHCLTSTERRGTFSIGMVCATPTSRVYAPPHGALGSHLPDANPCQPHAGTIGTLTGGRLRCSLPSPLVCHCLARRFLL
jgi:hypothetical protein